MRVIELINREVKEINTNKLMPFGCTEKWKVRSFAEQIMNHLGIMVYVDRDMEMRGSSTDEITMYVCTSIAMEGMVKMLWRVFADGVLTQKSLGHIYEE